MTRAERRLKIIGGIEALQALLEHAAAHLYEINYFSVVNYCEATKKELAALDATEVATPKEAKR